MDAEVETRIRKQVEYAEDHPLEMHAPADERALLTEIERLRAALCDVANYSREYRATAIARKALDQPTPEDRD